MDVFVSLKAHPIILHYTEYTVDPSNTTLTKETLNI